MPYIEGILADDVARAVVEALPAFAAGKIERGIRRKLKGRQYGSDGEEGAVLWIDDAVILPEKSKPCSIGKPAVDMGDVSARPLNLASGYAFLITPIMRSR